MGCLTHRIGTSPVKYGILLFLPSLDILSLKLAYKIDHCKWAYKCSDTEQQISFVPQGTIITEKFQEHPHSLYCHILCSKRIVCNWPTHDISSKAGLGRNKHFFLHEYWLQQNNALSSPALNQNSLDNKKVCMLLNVTASARASY